MRGWRYESARHAMAARGMRGYTASKENPIEYIQENIRSTEKGDRTEKFKQGVKDVMFHPWQESERDWQSYTRAKSGHAEMISQDPVNKWNQRGAGLFGRVVTMANMEPLIDREKGKNFRQSVIDIEFGRRS